MRAALSRFILTLLERHNPDWIRRLEVQILLNLASHSFGRRRLWVWHMPAPKALSVYAAYTLECMARTEADPGRLYAHAFLLGKRLRGITGLSEQQDIQRLIFYLYRNIHVSMGGALPGEITVPRCYFKGFYTPEQCRLMSNVDAGIIAGLSGGGRLYFTERLTEGAGQCKAIFEKEESNEQ